MATLGTTQLTLEEGSNILNHASQKMCPPLQVVQPFLLAQDFFHPFLLPI